MTTIPRFRCDAKVSKRRAYSAALIGLLHAIPTTPLYDRLKQAGRLNDDEDSGLYGTNVVPLGTSREAPAMAS
ncbi:MAG: DUF4070 domain-containing protein [Hyphomicrobiales bacterium]